MISRDRADYYIRGAKRGAPQTLQTADRWHLMRNLHEALVRLVDRHHLEVQAAVNLLKGQRQRSTPRGYPLSKKEEVIQAKRLRRLRRHQQVIHLRRQGVSLRQISRCLGMAYKTVDQFASAERFPERVRRQPPRQSDLFLNYLQQRWAEGCGSRAS